VALEHLNLHHLLYFRAVAREGGVAKAAARLHVSAPTVSAQVKQLEQQVGDALLVRAGRRLVLSDLGRTVLHYADGIFDLAEELRGVVRSGHGVLATRLTVGLSMAVPKLIAHRLLEPALALEDPIELVCVEDKPDALLASLATHSIDLVLSDSPRSAEVAVRAFDHKLGECGVTFFAAAPLARKLRKGFPQSLDGAPMLLPTAPAAVRTELEHWFQDLDIRPRAVASFDDSALMKVFGARGIGVFAAPSAIESEVVRQYGVRVIGQVEAIRERFYAVSIERRLRHPAVVAISRGAREDLFLESPR
jgi:LysR family transcriptional activator of nhaA